MKIFHAAMELLRQYRKPYLTLNAFFYGLIVCGMVYAAFNREIQDALGTTARGQFATIAPQVATAYGSGQILIAIVLTFAINFFIGTIVCVAVPSLVVPFSGLCVGAVRAILWGLIFSPTWPASVGSAIRGLLIFGLLILEGQGFVLAMLAAYVHGANLLKRNKPPYSSRWQRYRDAVKQSARLYPLVALLLAAAAIYESLLVIVMLPLLS
jgi:hypothetical protein